MVSSKIEKSILRSEKLLGKTEKESDTAYRIYDGPWGIVK